jgi:hypothetical protein
MFERIEIFAVFLPISCENPGSSELRTEFTFHLKCRKAAFSVRRACKEQLSVGETPDVSICTALLEMNGRVTQKSLIREARLGRERERERGNSSVLSVKVI